jgi:hypothetical protein
VLGDEPTRRRGVVVEAVGAAAAFMVDKQALASPLLWILLFPSSLAKIRSRSLSVVGDCDCEESTKVVCPSTGTSLSLSDRRQVTVR